MTVHPDFSPISPCTHFLNSIHKSWKKFDLLNFFFKNHSISSKVTRLHNLGHISLETVGKFLIFLPFGFWFKKWVQAKVKENSGKSKFWQLIYIVRTKWTLTYTCPILKTKKRMAIFIAKNKLSTFSNPTPDHSQFENFDNLRIWEFWKPGRFHFFRYVWIKEDLRNHSK